MINKKDTKDKKFSKFLIFWSGQLISTIGSGITAFALGVFAFKTTQTATGYALITLFTFLPAFILRPFGGVLADRYDRKVLIIIGDFGSAIGLLFILFFIIFGDIKLWHIYAGVSISSIFMGIQNPSFKASVTDFLPEESYAKASGFVQLAQTAQFLISPIVAGLLLGLFDIKIILVIDIFTFLYANLTVLFAKKGIPASEKIIKKYQFIKDMKEGLTTITANKGIVWLIAITSIILFYIGILQSLFGPMILAFADSKSLGITLTVCACGMLLSSLIIGVFGIKKNFTLILSISLVFAGSAYSFIGLKANLLFIIISGFLFFFAVPYINSIIDLLIRKNISNEKQGRVWSMISVITYIGAVSAYCFAGILADNIFNPLLMSGGLLYSTIGQIIGTGNGRGIGFMFTISGVMVVILGLIIYRIKKIKELERSGSLIKEISELKSFY